MSKDNFHITADYILLYRRNFIDSSLHSYNL